MLQVKNCIRWHSEIKDIDIFNMRIQKDASGVEVLLFDLIGRLKFSRY